ncbi:gamma-secretase subunit PEN-2 [Parasteatoda tepidariorum]|uniref:gamma-secretase subunit PEN-2 n=1 Tax=Parasteatoda tepidariorum TaxID=114398 RepID=UPI000A2C08F7|nr:gamma-secretase subunit PEN-2 [Parasteatoda tepidariorum]
MDLRKMKNDEKLSLCRWYYRGGFFFLPFLWFVNAIWFFNEAFRKSFYEEQRMIRAYVIRSAIGAAVWAAGLITWIVIFQLNRADWGEFADSLSFIIPVGIP